MHRILLLAVLALSLVANGFAHRAPDSDDRLVAAMVALGASVDDICGGLGQPGSHADALCQACQIGGSADLPRWSGPSRPAALMLTACVSAPRESRTVARVLDMSRTPQAPPLA